MKDKWLFRFAHISDLHFSKLFFNPAQFFSKRWVGNLNLLLNRKKKFESQHLSTLIPLFKDLYIDAVLLTGDLTTTSHVKEYEMAQKFIEDFKTEGLKIHLIPGNHDHYTQSAYRKQRFYQYFDSAEPVDAFTLKKDKISVTSLGKEWWLFALDCVEATSLFSSHGVFSETLQHNLEQSLKRLPKNQHVILMNHFPLFESEEKKALERSDHLCNLLKDFPQIKLYIHGHTHRQIAADLRPSHLPIILDSGCTAQKNDATWNLIEIRQNSCVVTQYHRTPQKECQWVSHPSLNFAW